jgi:hypothetical protein
MFRRAGKGYRRSDERHELVLYERDEVLRALRAAGFEARALRGYGTALRFPPGLVGFAATRPPDGSDPLTSTN